MATMQNEGSERPKRGDKLDIIVTKVFPSGAWEVSAIVDGHRAHMVYMGYTKAEAVSLFRQGIGR